VFQELGMSSTWRLVTWCWIAMAAGWFTLAAPRAQGAAMLVKDGQAQARIVLPASSTRTQRFAARELQDFLKKISGATLPIETQPAADAVNVYIGRSAHTDVLGLDDRDLTEGAFRMVSGENWLAFVGRDDDYVVPEPWVRNPLDKAEVERVMKQWDEKSGGTWGNPLMSASRGYSPLLDLWDSDERGSLNGVYRFLSDLGVRWYDPGPLGLVLPTMKDIPLPRVDRTVRPDFAMRDLLIYSNEFLHARKGTEAIGERVRWQLWLGTRPNTKVIGYGTGHGTMAVIMRPEYYALGNGERLIEPKSYGVPCLSSEGLLEQNIKYVRAVFDIYNEPMISVAPSDGYKLCQCELCKGLDTPKRGYLSTLSDYVWAYTDKVAREIYKTHPSKYITCIAYSPYLDPPLKIETLSPNIVVGVCDWRSLNFDPAHRKRYLALREQWLAKIPSKKLWIWDYYLHGWTRGGGGPWLATPAYFPRLIAEDFRSLKGISLGDHIEIYNNNDNAKDGFDAMAVNHLNTYVTARCLWDANLDVEALLEEYYEVFYGPAASEMKAFMEYAEANWMNTPKDAAVIDRLFELIEPALTAAGEGSVYHQRIARINTYMQRLKPLRERLAKGRNDAPELRALGRDAKDVVLDGKFDEAFWQGLEEHSLSDLITAAPPAWGTTFKVAWSGDSLYIGIVCRDKDRQSINVTTTAPGSMGVFDGDNIEILLETPSHAYYQIAINPAGVMVDLDRRDTFDSLWESNAAVACHISDEGWWSVEMRIPAAGSEAQNVNPQYGLSGDKPTLTYPWFINICRQRERADSHELSAFSPTGKPSFHEPMKFAKLWVP
jgi:hypothetical protein